MKKSEEELQENKKDILIQYALDLAENCQESMKYLSHRGAARKLGNSLMKFMTAYQKLNIKDLK